MHDLNKLQPLVRDLVLAGGFDKQDKSWAELASIYNVGNESQPRKKRGDAARRRWRRFLDTRIGQDFKSGKWRPTSERQANLPPEAPKDQFYYSKHEKRDFVVVDQYSSYISNEDDMAAFHGINRDEWVAAEKITNYYEQGAKLQINGEWVIAKTPLHQLKIKWKLRQDNIEAIKQMLLESIPLPEVRTPKMNNKGKLCLEIMITDLHLGKIGFDVESYEMNWTLKETSQVYNEAIDYFLSKVDREDIGQIVLPTGNDFLNIDNSFGTTTKGTPQMTGDFWASVFRYGKEMLFSTIEKLEKVAPVYVYMVKGNHDSDSVFSLGEAVEARFRESPNVTVKNEPLRRNYHEWGKCMIGYTHGDQIKKQDVYKAMSLDEPQMFGRTKYRAMHLGHLHTNRLKRVMQVEQKEEVNGVDVEICPSLSPTDAWHFNHLYVGNIRRTKTFVWHQDKGLIEEHYFNL